MKFRSSSRAVAAAVCVALAAPALAGKSDGGLGGEYHFTNNGDKKSQTVRKFTFFRL